MTSKLLIVSTRWRRGVKIITYLIISTPDNINQTCTFLSIKGLYTLRKDLSRSGAESDWNPEAGFLVYTGFRIPGVFWSLARFEAGIIPISFWQKLNLDLPSRGQINEPQLTNSAPIQQQKANPQSHPVQSRVNDTTQKGHLDPQTTTSL